jgi:hypothetical protein
MELKASLMKQKAPMDRRALHKNKNKELETTNQHEITLNKKNLLRVISC